MMNLRKSMINVNGKVKDMCARHQQYRRCLPVAANSFSTNLCDTLFERKGKEMFTVLPGVIDTLLSNAKFHEVPEVRSWIREVLDYNLNGGKKNRGVFSVLAYEMLEKPENITDESLKQARILGVCQEMLLGHYILIDDMIDGSTTRRGIPCWYLKPHVGLGAINDSVLIYCCVHETLKHYFESSPIYGRLLDCFNKIFLYSVMGQHMDHSTSRITNKNYAHFTMERFDLISKYKMASNTFCLPVYVALLLTNKMSAKTYRAATEICNGLGRLYQIQNDYIDCYSEENVSGKAGTDIQEGKCSWLAVSALQRCSEAQRALFAECYASKQPQHVARIKQLYEELDIPTLYKQEQYSQYQELVKKIKSLPSELTHALFLDTLNWMYKRVK